jgi:hypothetical protein
MEQFVMVASVQALLGIIESALPDLYRMFARFHLFVTELN